MCSDRRLRTVRRAVSTGTHIYSAGPLKKRLALELGHVTFEELPISSRCARPASSGPPSTGSTPASGGRGHGQRCRPGLLPPARVGDEHYLDGGIVNSIPVGRAVQLGATRIFVLQVGRIDRPLSVPRRPWEVARVSFEIAAGTRFARKMAELPDDVEAHVLPAQGTSTRRLAVRQP